MRREGRRVWSIEQEEEEKARGKEKKEGKNQKVLAVVNSQEGEAMD